MRVAIQGEAGSFSHEAAKRLFPSAVVRTCSLSAEVFDQLGAGAVDAAVIPMENSLAGPVSEHYDLLLTHDFFIEREFRLRIEHCLISVPGTGMNSIRRVLSHPVALQQCRTFFQKHTGIVAAPFYDTAGSVKHIMADGLADTAAIAGAQAAGEYGAKILKKGLEDDKQNFTRFVVLRKKAKVLRNADKTSIVFALKNQPGALFRALSVFALRDIDLSKIESRPMRGRPWEYVFFVDFHRGRDEAASNALRHLAEVAEFVKVLGVYPRV